uniref:smalltalk protein n=1 Tax=Prevotella sp. TaxID=59823 RepID=UPI004028103E
MNKDTWKTILKLIVAIATAVLSTLGVQARYIKLPLNKDVYTLKSGVYIHYL